MRCYVRIYVRIYLRPTGSSVSWLLYGIDRRLVEVGSSVTVLGPAAQAVEHKTQDIQN